jgi:hypothetical protein
MLFSLQSPIYVASCFVDCWIYVGGISFLNRWYCGTSLWDKRSCCVSSGLFTVLISLLTSVRSQSCFEKLYISVAVQCIYMCRIFQYTVKPGFVVHLWSR